MFKIIQHPWSIEGLFFLSRLESCDLFLSFNDIWPCSMSPRTESKQSHLCSFPVCRKAALVQFYLWSYLTVTHLEQPTCWNTKTLMANEHKSFVPDEIKCCLETLFTICMSSKGNLYSCACLLYLQLTEGNRIRLCIMTEWKWQL